MSEWLVSDYEDRWSMTCSYFLSKEEALAAASDREIYPWGAYVGRKRDPVPMESVFDGPGGLRLAGRVMDTILDDLYQDNEDYAIECVDPIDPTQDQTQAFAGLMRAAFASWLDAHGLRSGHFVVEDIEFVREGD